MKYALSTSIVTAFVVILFAPASRGDSASIAKGVPIGQLVQSHLAEWEGYRPGDILSRDQVRKIIAFLETQGVEIPNTNAMVDRALGSKSLLLKLFGTERGKRFLRQIGKIPGGYARLDRLAELPQGEALVRQLERDPGSDKLIEYLATTSGGRELGRMLAKTPRGVNPNQPTGRIYTAEDLIAALEKPATEGEPARNTPKVTRNH